MRAIISDFRLLREGEHVAQVRVPGRAGTLTARLIHREGYAPRLVVAEVPGLRPVLDASLGERFGNTADARDIIARWAEGRTLEPLVGRARVWESPTPANPCPYCRQPAIKGMGTCRRGACLTRAQIDIQTRGRVRS